MKKYLAITALAVTFFAASIFNQTNAAEGVSGKETLDQALPVVGTMDNLKKLIKKAQESNSHNGWLRVSLESVSKADSAQAPMAAGNSLAAAPDYSGTNVQVQGVDEADIVKTDGRYIYQVNRQRVIIGKAAPAEEMAVVSEIKPGDQDFSPREIYVEGDKLVVIGSSSGSYPVKPLMRNDAAPAEKSAAPYIWPPGYYYQPQSKVYIYDIANRANPVEKRIIAMDGNYVSSRKTEGNIYLIANRSIPYRVMENNNDDSVLLPQYSDTAAGNDAVYIQPDRIRYFPGCIDSNYLITGSFSLADINAPVSASAFLGSAENVYASQETLYVAARVMEEDGVRPLIESVLPGEPWHSAEKTAIYRFAIKDGKISYQTRGTVNGTVLNQFSMDEHNGFFRVALTEHNYGLNNTERNSVVIMNSNMEITGQIKDIAPGERIYSARFMGEKAYLVTFKKVDPLFVLDLKDPAAPRILGKLKIPGYSDYLHPFGENYLIGFGKDTVELSNPYSRGETMAYYQGMKIAIFDVTDVNNPIELHKVGIGARGTDSELLHNHKALLFNSDSGLMAFPVTVMEAAGSSPGGLEYGSFAFQGAYVYNVSVEDGFTLKGRITHIPEETYKKAGDSWPAGDLNISRILYIGNGLYTLSEGMWQVNSLENMRKLNSINIK